MFFDTNKAQFKEVRAHVNKSGPAKAFAFKIYCFVFLVSFLYLIYIFSLGLSESLEWGFALAGILPLAFLYGLWEVNIPANAQTPSDCWPKVWYIRNKQIWPRQK